MERLIVVVGSLAALEQSTLSVKVSGRLQSIPVDLGTRVEKGQIIAQIERRDYELRLKQAEAFLTQARARLGLPVQGGGEVVDPETTSTVREARAVLDEANRALERAEQLYKRKIGSESELETARASQEVAANKHRSAVEEIRDRIGQLAQRTAEVEIVRQQLADSTIVAPFSGVVQERRAYVGEFLAVGAPLATLVQTDSLRLRMEIPEREAPKVRTGLKVRLHVEGDATRYPGEITRLSPSINESTRILVAEADVKNVGTLRPGSFARAEIVVEEHQPTIAIPKDAILSFAGLEKIFLVRDGKAVERNINSGRQADGFVEVPADIKAGDVVVLNPGNLQNGQPVSSDVPAAGPRNPVGDTARRETITK